MTLITRVLPILLLSFLISGCETIGQGSGFSATDGVKELLKLSTERATKKLTLSGGYGDNEEYEIQVTNLIKASTEVLKAFGLSKILEDIEEQLNRSAEIVAGEANDIFIQEIRSMQVTDALGLIQGGNTAATDYFESRTRDRLKERYGDLVRKQLKKLDFYSDYRNLMTAYKWVPLPNKPDLDLESVAIDMGLNALFSQIAEEERKIRKNPAEVGNVLLSTLLKQYAN